MNRHKYRAFITAPEHLSYGKLVEVEWIDWRNKQITFNGVATGMGFGLVEQANEGEFELMQHTGFTDLNGKDIYEKDLVKYRLDFTPTTESGAKERISEVFWSDFRGVWAVYGDGLKKMTNNDLFQYVQNGNTVEIIGNVFEHSQLPERS